MDRPADDEITFAEDLLLTLAGLRATLGWVASPAATPEMRTHALGRIDRQIATLERIAVAVRRRATPPPPPGVLVLTDQAAPVPVPPPVQTPVPPPVPPAPESAPFRTRRRRHG